MSGLRLRRIHLRDFRGVEDSEVSFADHGVTIVVGPNEIGKSSLAEALDLVLDELDRTNKAWVREIKPVHRDAGPEVEVDLAVGPYDLTLRKRYLKRQETHLTIRAPRQESLTGDDAHERVQAILRAETDDALFRALRIRQGNPLDLPAVGNSPSLAAALDRAAGGEAETGDEGTLFERAQAEFLRYYTPQGAEKKTVFGDARDAIARDRTDAETLARDLRALEADIDRAASLAAELATARGSIGPLRDARDAAERDVTALAALREAVAVRATALAEATAADDRARRAQVERETLIAAATAAREEVARLTARDAAEADGLVRAEEANTAAASVMTAAREARDAAAAVLGVRRADVDASRDADELSGLRERQARAEAAADRGRAARARLDADRVDEATLRAIDAAHLDEERAAARLSAGSPVLHLTALVPIAPVIDGTAATLAAGESLERSVEGSLTVEIPGIAEVRLAAGTSAEALTAALDAARRHVAELCAAAGVADPAAAHAAHEDRRAAQAEMDDAARTVRDARGDLTADALAARIAALEERIARLTASRPAEPAPAGSVEEARALLAAAATADADAAAAFAAAERAAEVARTAVEERRRAAAERGAFMVAAREAQERADASLAAARATADDAALAAARAEAEIALAAARAAHAEAAGILEAANPASVELLAANARRALSDAEVRLRDLETESAGVGAGLRVRGEEGLRERLEEATGRVERAEAALASVARRAAAARVLYATLREARDEANRRYAAPLRKRIVELGKVVFGADFSVELRDDLTIDTRTLDGRTVPWNALSGGAKEQLAVLVRLAAASIVSDSGGVPVILDDVLGYSDPTRLQAMGALLAEAGRTGQVIVLTCFPERYAHVGGARRERLG